MIRATLAVYAGVLVLAAAALAQPGSVRDENWLPDDAKIRLGSSRFREPSHISAAALAPDGKTLAIANSSLAVRFLDVATGKELRRVAIRENIYTGQLIWTNDGNQFITTGYQGINIWDAKDGKLVRQAPNPNRDGRNGSIHVSADGKFAAVGSQYENAMVRVVDLTNGNQLSTIKPLQTAQIFGVMSPKGELVATFGHHYNRGNGNQEEQQAIPRTVQIWDAKEGKEKVRIVSDIAQLTCVRFSPDGAKIATSGNGMVQLWDVATGKQERRFAGRTGQGLQLVFSADGKLLSAAGQDGCVQSWEVATGKRAGICDGPAANVAGLLYRPDGQLMAWAINVNAVEIWEVPSGKRLTPQGGHTAPVSALQFAGDGKTLISCGNDGRMLRWDLATGKEMEPFELKESEAKRRMYGYPRGYTGPSHFSPNGKYLVASGSTGGSAAVWDVDAGLELFALSSTNGYVDRSGIIAFSPDSTRLVAMQRYNGREQPFPIPVWDMETGAPLPALKGQKGDFTAAGFSTDGKILTTCGYFYPPNGGQVAEAWSWDMATGKVLSRVQMPNVQFNAVQFIDQRQFVLISNNNQPFKVYDAVTGGEVRTLEGGAQNGYTTTLTLSPDRRLLAFGRIGYQNQSPDGRLGVGRAIVIWEVATGSIRHEFGGLDGSVTSLAFTRDGKTLASGWSDTTIVLWDLVGKVDKVEPLKPGDLVEHWQVLEGVNAKKAEASLRKLGSRPVETLKFLQEELKPVAGVKADPARIAKLIADLDSARYAVRETATRDLERLGNLALTQIQDELKKPSISPELRERLDKLTDRIGRPNTGAEWVRALRGVELLERIGSAEALVQLRDLAAGGDAPPTRAAREALGRLGVK